MINPRAAIETLDVTPPPLEHRVFVNRNLRLDSVKAVGFDLDYTLARYRRERLESLAFSLTADKLMERGYTLDKSVLVYDPTFVVRGLVVDKELGNILKLDRHHHVARAFHGRRQLSKSERRKSYRGSMMTFAPPRFAIVDTYFELPEICLFAAVVDYLELDRREKVDYWQLLDDIRECIDLIHRDDSLKSIVVANIEEYIERDHSLCRLLHKFRSAKKTLFLMTNSYWEYTDKLMSFLLDGQLADYPTWRSYFDVVVVGAQKPGFFANGNLITELGTDGNPVAHNASAMRRGRIYQGGQVEALEKVLRACGEDVLYFGDHIYGDILRSKRSALWRTVLVIEELEYELREGMRHSDKIKHLYELERHRRNLDDLTNVHRQNLNAYEKAVQSGGIKVHENLEGELRQALSQAKRSLKGAIGEWERVQTELDDSFNPFWGMVFKQSQENTRFAEQVTRHACLYTGRVSNFLRYSNYQYFRSPRDLMPHEFEHAELGRS